MEQASGTGEAAEARVRADLDETQARAAEAVRGAEAARAQLLVDKEAAQHDLAVARAAVEAAEQLAARRGEELGVALARIRELEGGHVVVDGDVPGHAGADYCTPRLQLLTKFHSCPVPASATGASCATIKEATQPEQEAQEAAQASAAAQPGADGPGSPLSDEEGHSPMGPTTPSGAASPDNHRSSSGQGSSLDASPLHGAEASAAARKPPVVPDHQQEAAEPVNGLTANAAAVGADAGSVPLPLLREGGDERLGRLGSFQLGAIAPMPRNDGAGQCPKPPLHPANSGRMDSLASSLDSVYFDARSEGASAAAAAEMQVRALLLGPLHTIGTSAEFSVCNGREAVLDTG